MRLPCGLDQVEVDIHILGHLVSLGFVVDIVEVQCFFHLSLDQSPKCYLDI